MQYRFERIDKLKGEGLSATLFGTVVHHAVHAFERKVTELRGQGVDVYEAMEQAVTVGQDTFDRYWHPARIGELTDGQQVTVWIGYGQWRDSYGSLRQRGLDAIVKYAEVWRADKHELLSLEHPFEVPVQGSVDPMTGALNTISGFVDRLTLRYDKRRPVLDTDDWKTGRRHYGLRHHIGLTVYCYASTQVEFWQPFEALGADPKEMFERFEGIPRRAYWYDLKQFERFNAGYRSERDYARLAFAVTEMVRSVQAGIFPLRMSGEHCPRCAHNNYCPSPNVGLPSDEEGSWDQ